MKEENKEEERLYQTLTEWKDTIFPEFKGKVINRLDLLKYAYDKGKKDNEPESGE